MTLKKNKIDLEELPPAQRLRVERVLNPRDMTLGTRHSRTNIEAWKKAAEDEGVSFREWVERKLNE